jgi:hypothetical protein
MHQFTDAKSTCMQKMFSPGCRKLLISNDFPGLSEKMYGSDVLGRGRLASKNANYPQLGL